MSNAIYNTNKDVPQDMLLGNLVFMNLSDMRIDQSNLHQIFQSQNVPEDFIRDISAADAFRRATSSIKSTRINIIDPSGRLIDAKLEVDEVRCDSDSIKRVVGVKAVDDTSESVAYESVMEIVFNRKAGTAVFTPMTMAMGPNLAEYEKIGQQVVDRFNDWSVYHNKDTVKNMINRIIQSTHPVNLMPTGLCKFIPKAHTDLLYNLKNALEVMSAYRINPSDHENICEIIPVIDTIEQRGLVERNFDAEITNDMFAFTQELKDVIQAKQSLSARSANAYIEKFKALQEKASEYEGLLGFYRSAIHQQIQEALQLIDDNVV